MARDPFLKSPDSYMYLCQKTVSCTFAVLIIIQDQDIDSFEIKTRKTSGNETEWTEYELKSALLFLGFTCKS